MKHIYAIILLVALTMSVRLCFAQKVSAFYTLPEGAFVSGTDEKGTITDCDIYIPYSTKDQTWTSIDPQGNGTWKIVSQVVGYGSSYTRPYAQMNSHYQVPQLEEEGKEPYQYGSMGTTNDRNTVRIGDSVSHFMTPAKLICDRVTIREISNAGNKILARAACYNASKYNVMGLYFDNKEVMYIEGVRIPITSYDENHPEKVPFPEAGSHIKVNIYPAKVIGGREENIADRTHVLANLTLTEDNYIANEEENQCGVVQGYFQTPISVSGPFVVELSEMQESGCDFNIWASRERIGCNYWGYHVEGNKETYHDRFTPAISVKAMFPALYSEESEETEIVIPAEGIDNTHAECQRTIYANMTYKKGEKGFSHNSNEIEWCKIYKMMTTKDHVTFAFTAEANTTNTPREADFVFSFRGKSLTYHLYQPPQGRTVVRNGLTKGNLGTICVPYPVTALMGASLWEIAYLTDNTLVLEESQTMEAGVPYIFKAERERIEGVIGTAQPEPEAQAKNGLHGTLTIMRDEELEGKYVMANNQLVRCGSGCELGPNRAYMELSEVPTTATPAKEGVRRMTMGMEVTTGLQGTKDKGTSAQRATKDYMRWIEDGIIYIQMNGQVIGINGQRIW